MGRQESKALNFNPTQPQGNFVISVLISSFKTNAQLQARKFLGIHG